MSVDDLAPPPWGRAPIRRQLEQDSARLGEVDRLEPEPVDDRGGPAGGSLDSLAQIELMGLIVHAPGEMVDRAHAPHSAPRLGRLGHVDEGAGSSFGYGVALPFTFGARRTKSHDLRKERGRGRQPTLADPCAVETADLVLGRDGARRGGREGAPAGRGRLDERDLEPMRIGQGKRLFAEAGLDRAERSAVAVEPLGPPLESVGRHRQGNLAGQAVSGDRRGRLIPWEKGKVRSKSQIDILRNGELVFTGHVSSLKRFKDDVKEVAENFECGITLNNFTDIQVGDIIEAFDIEQIARKL